MVLRFWQRQRGAGLTEYGLMIGMLSGIALATLGLLGESAGDAACVGARELARIEAGGANPGPCPDGGAADETAPTSPGGDGGGPPSVVAKFDDSELACGETTHFAWEAIGAQSIIATSRYSGSCQNAIEHGLEARPIDWAAASGSHDVFWTADVAQCSEEICISAVNETGEARSCATIAYAPNDSDPDGLDDFVDLTDVPLAAPIRSNVATIDGFCGATSVAAKNGLVALPGGPGFETLALPPGTDVELEIRSSPRPEATTTMSIMANGETGFWSVTTRAYQTAVFDKPTESAWTVPEGVSEIIVKAWGAGGGGGAGDVSASGREGGPGGGGGFVQSTLAVTPGEILTVVVGAGGRGGLMGVQNAGGTGGTGGGYSGMFRGAPSQEFALIVAGAGGGGGGNHVVRKGGRLMEPWAVSSGGAGGPGGGYLGAEGGDGHTGSEGGKGGTQSGPGAGGSGDVPGFSGGALKGGAGEAPADYAGGKPGGGSAHLGVATAGGGGAGYWGGGAGAAMDMKNGANSAAGGGGGSGFAVGTDTRFLQGVGSLAANSADEDYRAGHGRGGEGGRFDGTTSDGADGGPGLIVIRY